MSILENEHPVKIVIPQDCHRHGNYHFGYHERQRFAQAEETDATGKQFCQQERSPNVQTDAACPNKDIFHHHIRRSAVVGMECPFVVYSAINQTSCQGTEKRRIDIVDT